MNRLSYRLNTFWISLEWIEIGGKPQSCKWEKIERDIGIGQDSMQENYTRSYIYIYKQKNLVKIYKIFWMFQTYKVFMLF